MKEIVARFRSVRLQNERPIWIRPPCEKSSADHLVIFLDAEFYRDRVGATEVIEELQGSIADSWFVFVSMESLEARWLECPCYRPFAAFLAEELLPWLKDEHRELRSVRRTTLVGLSYTGLAAAFAAKEYPGVFDRVISQSGSFWWKDCWLAEQYRQGNAVPTEFYLDVGTKEVAENVKHREDVLQVVSQIEGVRRFRDVLNATGHSVRYVEFDGAHEFSAWRRTLPEALRWALSNQQEREGVAEL